MPILARLPIFIAHFNAKNVTIVIYVFVAIIILVKTFGSKTRIEANYIGAALGSNHSDSKRFSVEIRGIV